MSYTCHNCSEPVNLHDIDCPHCKYKKPLKGEKLSIIQIMKLTKHDQKCFKKSGGKVTWTSSRKMDFAIACVIMAGMFIQFGVIDSIRAGLQ